MSTPSARPLLTDRDGRPIAQFDNPRTGAFEAAQGDRGGFFFQGVNVAWEEPTAALAANAVFTGSPRDFGAVHGANRFRAAVMTDQPGTLFVEQSRTGAANTWVMTHWQATVSQTDADAVSQQVARIDAEVVSQFARARYRNGATAQTRMRMLTLQTGV